MAFDIEKMKTDGVSPHLIELASMNQETFLLLIARRLEHDKLFQQFMGENAGSIEAMYPYAVAAGLMSESDREWLVDEGNPYKEEEDGEIWLVGDIYEDQDGMRVFVLRNTDAIDHKTELFENGTNYTIYLNGEELPYHIGSLGEEVAFIDTEEVANMTKGIQMSQVEEIINADAIYKDSSTAPTTVEVKVKAK